MRAKIGFQSQLPVLKVGVFGFCTDTNKLYIGSSVGNLPILLQNPPLTNTGTPLNVVTPTFIGQTYVDTTAKEAYIANGLSSSDWQSISMDELGSGGGSSDWSSITNKPNFSTVATSGSYADLVNKPTLATIATTGNYNDLINKPLGVTATTSDVTYYVDGASGLDTNDGLTSGTAFKTIQKAIDILPKIINHAITIQLTSNTYDALHTISGFMGGGSITLKGSTTKAGAVDYIIKGTLLALNNSVKTVITGIKLMPSTFTATKSSLLLVDGSMNVILSNLLVDGTKGNFTGTSIKALYMLRSFCYVTTCDVSNITSASYSTEAYGFVGGINAVINSQDNTGSNNAYGLVALSGATISKLGTQPSGTTAELVGGGSVIR